MERRMSRWGVGPLFASLSLVFSLLVGMISFYYFPLKFTLMYSGINVVLGVILLAIGLPLFLIAAYTLHKHFQEGKLQSTGVYSWMRHPIYGSWIVFIAPGIVLIFGFILGIIVPFFMYILFRFLIVKEEKYLEEKFGREYLNYKSKVPRVWPSLFKRNNYSRKQV